MSLIENALKKLQGARAVNGGRSDVDLPKPPAAVPVSATVRTAIPIARKKMVVEDTKHHVSQERLIAGGLLAPFDHANAVTNEFRRIKRPILANAASRDHSSGYMNVIMVSSALPRAGKTFCSVNLAASISLERELNVLLVDADVAKPHISGEFGLGEAPGLIDLLVDDSRDVESTLVRTDLNDIQVLPAGRRHAQATELLASDRMSWIVEELATRYPDRIILLDSPPLLVTSESPALASKVGQIILIVEAGSTSQQEILQMKELIDPNKAINLILNKTSNWTQLGEYYGDYGYGRTST